MAKTEFSNNVICDTCKKPGRLDDFVRSFKVLTSSGEYETGVRACLDCVEIEYKGLHFKRFISYIMSMMLVPGLPLVVNKIGVGGRPSLLDIAGMILFALGFCGIILALVFHNPRKKALDYAIRKGLEHKIPPRATCVKPIREEATPFVPPADRDGKSYMVTFPSLKIMFGSRLTRLYAIRTLRTLGKPKSAKSLVGAMMVQASCGPDHPLADEVLIQEIEEAKRCQARIKSLSRY